MTNRIYRPFGVAMLGISLVMSSGCAMYQTMKMAADKPAGAKMADKSGTMDHSKMPGMAMASKPADAKPAAAAAKDDEGSGHDYRTFYQDGKVVEGAIGDSYTADLVVYVAGNQYMVMDELIKDFLKANPTVKSVYVETIPPGQILKEQILAQGEINGQKTAQNPDVYGSVELKHLKKLKEAGLMDSYTTYVHNKLELMVAAGNPKNIKGAEDLGRDDLVQSHPNPINEGIFTFYGSEMLKGLNLYDKVTGGKNCKGCWAVDNKVWFTERHHRETPARIEKGEADVGIVWSTEVLEAKSQGRKIDGVPIAAPHNMSSKVSYVAGALKTGRNQENAKKYLDFLLTNSAQDIYAKYGFAKAVPEEMKFSGL